jgi:hypothetical protein
MVDVKLGNESSLLKNPDGFHLYTMFAVNKRFYQLFKIVLLAF